MSLSSFALFVTTIVVCLPVIVVKGQQLNCYQCNSTLNHNCQEFFDHTNAYRPIESLPCHMHNAKFCVKVTGLWGGIVGTHRFCSSRDLGNQCQDMRFPDHSRKYRGCIYSCTADGCNGASSIFSYSVAIVTLSSVILSLLWR